MKKFILLFVFAVAALACSESFAQCFSGSCFGGSCYGGQCFSGSVAGRAVRASARLGEQSAPRWGATSFQTTQGGYCVGGRCASGARSGRVVGEYLPVESTAGACVATRCEPCAATIQTASDAFDAASACPCDSCVCDPCQCAETVEACEPVETVETTETTETTEPVPACGSVAVQTTTFETVCANGVCQRRPVASAVKTTVAASYIVAANAVRALRGLRPLVLDQSLDAGSYNHAVSMSHYGALYHASGVREIVAKNYNVGVDEALQQWTDSPRHAALLFNPNYTRAGIAAYRDQYGRNWCVMRFN